MSVNTFGELASHIGHRIVCVGYGRGSPVNVAVECETCNVVILDYDTEDEGEDDGNERPG